MEQSSTIFSSLMIKGEPIVEHNGEDTNQYTCSKRK